MSKTIQEQLDYISTNYAGTHKEDLLAIWEAIHIQDSLRIAIDNKREDDYLKLGRWISQVEVDNTAKFERTLAGYDNLKKEIIELWDYLHKQERPEPILQVKLLHPNAKVPTRGSEGAIGWDLYINDVTRSPLLIPAGDRLIIDTGISVAIPHGYYGRIAPRSGLAAKQGIDVLAGVVDGDYRGEIKVILYNTTHNQVVVDQTKPIAQLILERADQGKLLVVDKLLDTARGTKGFGSTDSKDNKDKE